MEATTMRDGVLNWAFALGLVCVSGLAHAKGWYLGAGIGAGKAKDADQNVSNGVAYLSGLGLSGTVTADTGQATYSRAINLTRIFP